MRRLYFSLYAAIAVAFAMCAIGIPWLINHTLVPQAIRDVERIGELPRFLFEEELANLPPAQWADHVAALRKQFGYDLALVEVGAVRADPHATERVQHGLTAGPLENNEANSFLLPIRGSRYVINVGLAETPGERAGRSVQGFFHLIERRLAPLSAAQRRQDLAQLSQRFGVPLTFVDSTLPELQSTQRRSVLAGEIVSVDVDGLRERHFRQLALTGSPILEFGPLPRNPLLRAATSLAIAVCAVVFALILLLWIRPLWRDMKSLDQSALRLGAGDLDTRAQVRPRSGIATLANAFNTMAQRIQDSLLRQRELTNAVSHELRTPISRMRFAVELLRTQAAAPQQAALLDNMRLDLDELATLVDESLVYSRLTHQRTPLLNLQQVELRPWIQDLLRQSTRPEDRIAAECIMNDMPDVATMDPQLMARAVRNLLRNATSHARSRVRISIGLSGADLRITVDDDGCGIAPDQHERIFDPFYRIGSAADQRIDGYGLGLAIVKRICEWHGARIDVGASPFGGARFAVTLGYKTTPNTC